MARIELDGRLHTPPYKAARRAALFFAGRPNPETFARHSEEFIEKLSDSVGVPKRYAALIVENEVGYLPQAFLRTPEEYKMIKTKESAIREAVRQALTDSPYTHYWGGGSCSVREGEHSLLMLAADAKKITGYSDFEVYVELRRMQDEGILTYGPNHHDGMRLTQTTNTGSD